MSKEQEDAAKWAFVEDYKKIKEHLHALRVQLGHWSGQYAAFGKALQENPTSIDSHSLNALPEGVELRKALADMKETERAFENALKRLRDVGVEPF